MGPRSVSCPQGAAWIAVAFAAIAIQAFGVWVFITGMYPMQPSSGGASSPVHVDGFFMSDGDDARDADGSSLGVDEDSGLFGRVVFILIDALRAQLIYGEPQHEGMQHPMPFVRSLIENGSAFAYVATANPPTVTLPRLKSIMSGTIPSFQDGLYNFGGDEPKRSAASEDGTHSPSGGGDHLVDIWRSSGKSIVFYGDDTWLRVFPNKFLRQEGTTSFLVTDFTQVDDNVTRNLWPELEDRSDWDVLIAHYLGLDHIGHFDGPYSSHMPAKQKEMDDIIRRVYDTLMRRYLEEISSYRKQRHCSDDVCAAKPKPPLFVLCSDHGMAETGGHGGSSLHEVSTTWVLMSPAWHSHGTHNTEETTPHDMRHGDGTPHDMRHGDGTPHDMRHGDGTGPTPYALDEQQPRRVHQVDIAVTLSLLQALPIPTGSIGVFPIELLQTRRGELSNATHLIKLLYRNALHMHGLLCSTDPSHCCMRYDDTSGVHMEHCVSLALAEEARMRVDKHVHQEEWMEYAWKAVESYTDALEEMQSILIGAAGKGVEWRSIAMAVSLMGMAVMILFSTAPLSPYTCAMALCQRVHRTLTPPNDVVPHTQWRSVSHHMVLACGTIAVVASYLASSLVDHERITWNYLTTTLMIYHLAVFLCTSWEYADRKHMWIRAIVSHVALVMVLRASDVWLHLCNGIPVISGAPPSATPPRMMQWLSIAPITSIAHAVMDPNVPMFIIGGIEMSVLEMIAIIAPQMVVGRNEVHAKKRFSCLLRMICVSLVCATRVSIPQDVMDQWNVPSHVTIARMAIASIISLWGYDTIQWLLCVRCDAISRDGDKRVGCAMPPTVSSMMSHMSGLHALLLMAQLIHKPRNVVALALLWACTCVAVYAARVRRVCGVYPMAHGDWTMWMEWMWLGERYFFALGGSNTLSTIDISGAYIAQTEFYLPLVGAMAALILYSGPIMAFVGSLYTLDDGGARDPRDGDGCACKALPYAMFLCSYRAGVVLVASVQLVLMKDHIFIWSVFTPKWVYEVAKLAVCAFAVVVLSVQWAVGRATKRV